MKKQKKQKKQFFAQHAKSSAMLISLAIHGVLIAVAIVFVVATVMPKTEAPFVPKKVMRPKMPPKPIKVPIDTKKRKPKPRLRQRIISDRKTLTDIRVPEISGVTGGLGNMGGTGSWNLGFDIKMDLFGSNKGMGNELKGVFFDLKQTRDGAPVSGNKDHFFTTLNDFVRTFRIDRFDNYFKAPQEKYATFFWMPYTPSTEGPKAFGVDKVVKPNRWAAYYSGHIMAPETDEYRFCGLGDDILIVSVQDKVVLDACYPSSHGKYTTRRNPSGDDEKWPIIEVDKKNQKFVELMRVGHWIKLRKGEKVPIDILIGDGGGECYYRLLIQQKSKEYPQANYDCTVWYKDVSGQKKISGSRPILPIFKLAEIPPEMHSKMKVDPNIATVEGPVFGVMQEL